MVTLSNILEKLGYDIPEQQIALIQLAAFTECFDNKLKDEKSYLSTIISTEKASELSSTIIFESLQQGLKWWIDTTQAAWFRRNQYLRTEFYKNKIKQSSSKLETESAGRLAADINRWGVVVKNEISQYLKELSSFKNASEISDIPIEINELEIREKLKNICGKLNLIQPVEFKNIEKSDIIVLHGFKDNFVRQSIKFIDKRFTGSIHYLTNARFLDINEKSLPFILGKWFRFNSHKSKKIERQIIKCIQKILQIEQKKIGKDRRTWNNNLAALQNVILIKLKIKKLISEEETWPVGFTLFYCDPGIYLQNAQIEGLTYRPDGWPTAADMVKYWLEKHFKNGMRHITFCPVYPNYDENPRIATTEDILHQWYKKYGKYYPGKHFVFISNNKKLHYIPYQDMITREVLFHEKANLTLETVGPGIKDNEHNLKEHDGFCFTYAIDALAKKMHSSKVLIDYRFSFFGGKNLFPLYSQLDEKKYENTPHYRK